MATVSCSKRNAFIVIDSDSEDTTTGILVIDSDTECATGTKSTKAVCKLAAKAFDEPNKVI